MESKIYFRDFLESAFEHGDYGTDDVIHFLMPLFREVLSFHEDGKVAPFEDQQTLFITNGKLDIDENFAHAPKSAENKIAVLLQRQQSSQFEVVGIMKMDADIDAGTQSLQNLQVHPNLELPFTVPAYLPGYSSYEIISGHHDDLTDIFCLGLLLGSISLGLDLNDIEDLKLFAAHRSNPALYNSRIHPTISALVTGMTELDRRKRIQDLYDVIQRLENYRDFDPSLSADLSRIAGWKTKEISGRGAAILGKLRNRLFDTSRRNRLLYYKPNLRFVNLTVSSVPMVLHYQSIRPEHLFTWNHEIAEKVKDLKDILLNKYLRFEDHEYISSSLDKIRAESQHDIREYGFSQLKLVVAFLNWHNLREDKHERIQSPLLLIPVELKKNKKVKEDHYVLKILANEAEVNPVLSNQLRELYGIRLPDFIDLDETTVEAFYEKLKEQINGANQGVSINYIDKPRIKLIHSVARQTLSNYKKRLHRGKSGLDTYRNIEYSYQQENYKPLGLEIYRQRIENHPSFSEFLVNEDVKISNHHVKGERELFELAGSDDNPYSWDFDVCNIVLGNFNYKKMSLVRDYNQVIDSNLHHSVFENLFSDQPKQHAQPKYTGDKPESWYHVITADPTQTRAILQAREGESYIIQGPPGTGKSQTITNLIADFMARGKSVLFVCEKRAALDVVYHRLKQQGLDELCCYIHDSQGDKKEFIKSLKQTFEGFTKSRPDFPAINTQREQLLQAINKSLEILEKYHGLNAGFNESAGMEIRALIERVIELKDEFTVLSETESELLPAYREWNKSASHITDLSRVLEDTGSDPWFSGHPLSRIREGIFLSENPVALLKRLVLDARTQLQEITTTYSSYGISDASWTNFTGLKALIEDAVLLQPLAETGNINLAEPLHADSKSFDRSYRELLKLKTESDEIQKLNKSWRAKFSEQDVNTAIPIALANESSFFSFFNGDWRRLKKNLNHAYDFSAHQVRPAYSSILENLRREYAINTRLKNSAEELQQDYHFNNLETAVISIERLRAKKGDKEVDYLVQHPEAASLVRQLYKLNTNLWQLEASLKELFHDHEKKTISGLQDDLLNLEMSLKVLPDLLPALRRLSQTSERIKKAVRSLPLRPLDLEGNMATKTLDDIFRESREFQSVDGKQIEDAVSQVHDSYNKLLGLNAELIKGKIHQQFLDHYELSNMAVSQLNPDQRAFRKSYLEGRKVLENEFGKSMRFKSIRELAGRETGMVLKDLKPVWLMSPLSVSDSLPIDGKYFDVVIFDEASQITLEEGVPSVYRAPQTIIVGDDKQMPPSNFFSARAEDPDDLQQHSGEDDDDLLSNDADSLLVQGSRKLNSVMLGWHYRSRYETLISYSNHAFYEANLLTIPDRTIHDDEKSLINVQSPGDASGNIEAIFDRSISYHYLANSVYEKRSNIDEANYIANLVATLLKKGVKESIGIVAFSQEQQNTIENALTDLASGDKAFEQLLEEAYERTENDQYIGLIIKNLENIQGDERDIIIMSICYGFDSQKRMIMNFGPINRKGGEKRLNVIFSRAKKHMAVITSIHHHNITNEYNEGANYFKRFLHYAEEVSIGNMQMARTILDGLLLKKENKVGPSSGIVAQQVKSALVQEGFVVDENIGQSEFKCSLAIRSSNPGEGYMLGILVDDASHYENENVLEQYYQRPAILEDFGWLTISVFSKDWLEDSERVMSRIRKKLS